MTGQERRVAALEAAARADADDLIEPHLSPRGRELLLVRGINALDIEELAELEAELAGLARRFEAGG